MKKRLCMFLVLVLCMTGIGALAEGEPAERTVVDPFFRCRVGSIVFTLPGYPQIFHEIPVPARALEGTYLAWDSKTQLTGWGMADGEYQVHIADMTPAIAWMKEDRPGEDEVQYQLNAMMNLVQFYLDIHSGSLAGEVQADWTEIGGKVIPSAEFAFTYPDAPGVVYQGKGFVDGGMAVIMMVQADDENLAYLQDMAILPGEDVIPTGVPETVTIGRLQVTFPEAPLKDEKTGHWLYQAFTDDYGYIAFEHMEADLSFMLEAGMTMNDLLPTLAEVTAQQYQAQGVIQDYETKKLADGMFAFVGMEIDTRYPEGHGPVASYVMGIFTKEGVYTLTAVETEMGKTFFDSLTVVE